MMEKVILGFFTPGSEALGMYYRGSISKHTNDYTFSHQDGICISGLIMYFLLTPSHRPIHTNNLHGHWLNCFKDKCGGQMLY